MAKLYATEAAQRAVDRCVQLHGGLGVAKGHKAEELYREVRALRVYEGASEVQRVVIARAEMRAHAAAPLGRRRAMREAGMDGMGRPQDAASPSAHVDTFARDNLPPREAWPVLRFDLPELRYPRAAERAAALLDAQVEAGRGGHPAVIGDAETLTYRSSRSAPTASRPCWCATSASSPATACCCAPPTRRGWSPRISAC